MVQVLNGAVTLKADMQATAPRTLRTLIADRVSRLPQRERRVLQGLAIVGEPAATPMLSSLLDQPLPNLDRHVSALEDKGLVRRVGATHIRFASPLYQEIVLDAMPAGTGRELHARAAETYSLSELAGPGEAAERTAEHLSAASEPVRAVDFFWQSAEQRLLAGRLEGALRVMLRGLSLSEVSARPTDELVRWLERIATTVSSVRQAPGLSEALSPALREVDRRGSQAERVMGHVHVARALGSVNLFDEAYEALGYADPDTLSDDALRRASLIAEAQLASRQGLFVRAVRAADRLATMDHGDDPETLLTMALARCMGGDSDEGMKLLDRLDGLAPPKDAAERVTRDKHRVLAHFNARDWDAAARAAARLAEVAQAAGLRFDIAAALHNLGDCCDRLGDHPRAYAAFVESLEHTRQLEHDRLSNLNRMHLCLLDGLRSATGAGERLKGLVRYADARGYLWDVLEGRFLLARLAVAHGDHQSAREQLGEIITRADEQGHHLIGVDARELLAKLSG
jgi:tetratricopeptide (TPR) repeat protein